MPDRNPGWDPSRNPLSFDIQMRQSSFYDRQTKRTDELMDKRVEQDQQFDKLLDKQDEQVQRFDKLLDKWEEQARRQDAILDTLEKKKEDTK